LCVLFKDVSHKAETLAGNTRSLHSATHSLRERVTPVGMTVVGLAEAYLYKRSQPSRASHPCKERKDGAPFVVPGYKLKNLS
jgi:hypothetical protein